MKMGYFPSCQILEKVLNWIKLEKIQFWTWSEIKRINSTFDSNWFKCLDYSAALGVDQKNEMKVEDSCKNPVSSPFLLTEEWKRVVSLFTFFLEKENNFVRNKWKRSDSCITSMLSLLWFLPSRKKIICVAKMPSALSWRPITWIFQTSMVLL